MAASQAADFNGDGFSDLAIDAPFEDLEDGEPIADVGAVNVLYGSASGLTATGSQFWHQDSPGVEGAAEPGDRFGFAVAAAEFNGDSFSDLAVGVPGEDVEEAILGAGVVHVLYGSASGLSVSGSQLWYQKSPGVKGYAENGDEFGSQLAAADFDGNGLADLAVGVPGEDVGTIPRAGAVNVLYGSATGLITGGNQLWHQNSPDVSGWAERFDHFGSSLAAANFGNSSQDDLAVGVPGEGVPGENLGVGEGAANVLYGSASGLAATGNQLWHQETPGVEGVAEAGDHFGFFLSAADFSSSSEADLAVGVPGEDWVEFPDAGVVHVFYGSPSGLNVAGSQLWSQNPAGGDDAAEEGDRFGWALAAADFGNSSQADLAVGVAFEDIGAIQAAGALHVFYGSPTGLTAAGSQFWSQDRPGVEGDGAEEGDRFGSSLAPGSDNTSAQTTRKTWMDRSAKSGNPSLSMGPLEPMPSASWCSVCIFHLAAFPRPIQKVTQLSLRRDS